MSPVISTDGIQHRKLILLAVVVTVGLDGMVADRLIYGASTDTARVLMQDEAY